MSNGPRSEAARRVLAWARIGKERANSSFSTETRSEAFDSGAVGDGVNFGTRSDRSHTDSGAENGKTTSAISRHAAVRVENQRSDIFVW